MSATCFSQKNQVADIIALKVTDVKKELLIDSLLKTYEGNQKSSIHNLTKYSIWLNKIKKYEKASEVGKKNLELTQKHLPNDSCDIQRKRYYLGYFYFKNKDFNKAIDVFQAIISKNSSCKYIAFSYNLIAKACRRIGDYQRAITYFEYTLESAKNKKDIENLVSIQNSFSQAYCELGGKSNIIKGRSYLRESDSLAQFHEISYKTKLDIYLGLFITYNFDETFDVQKGNYYLNKALHLATERKDSLTIAHIAEKRGNLYHTVNLDTAIYYHKKALKLKPVKDSTLTFFCYANLAHSYGLKKDLYNCTVYTNKSLTILLNKTIDELLNEDVKSSVYNCKSKNDLRIVLTEYCEFLVKDIVITNNKGELKQIIKLYYLIDEIIDLIQINSLETASKLNWRKEASKSYGEAVRACYLANDFSGAYYFMEKNKSLLLIQDVLFQKVEGSKKVPQSLITLKKNLQNDLYISERESLIVDNETRRVILQKKNELHKIKDSISALNPNLLQLEEDTKIQSLEVVQRELKRKSYILEYIINDEIGYGLLIGKKEVIPFEIDNLNVLNIEVNELLKLVKKPFNTVQEEQHYFNLANRVFLKLFPVKNVREKIKNQNLTIIPDGYLSFLPYEALVTNKEQKTYLIQETEVHYEFSNSFSKNNYKSDYELSSMVSFAPMNFTYDKLIKLPNSIREVELITSHLPSNSFINDQATKAQFLKELPKHNIIHLATHSSTNGSISPWIAFRNQKLSLDELYLTKNNANLVVLSACQTNTGKLEIGEGVMSLSRGFFQTGAKSVVSSLWNVDDKSTSEIITDFYKGLAHQETKSIALRNAKLKYLNKASLSEASPYYWASFVLIGNSDIVTLPKSYNWYYGVVGLLIILLIFFFFIRRKNN